MYVENYYVFKLYDKVYIIDLEFSYFVSIPLKFYSETLLFDRNSTLYKVLEVQKKKYKFLNSEKSGINTVYLFITDSWNLSCDFCCMRSDIKNQETIFLNYKILNNEVLALLNELKPRKIIVSGGEPLLHEKFLEILICLKENTKANLYLQSNGTLLKNINFAKLSKFLDGIEVSVGHYTDIKEVENIIINSELYKLKLTCTLTLTESIENRFDLLDIIVEHDVELLINFVNNTGSATDKKLHIMTFEEKLNVYNQLANYILDKKIYDKKLANIFYNKIQIRKSCNAMGKIVAIFPNGDTYMCHSLEDNKFKFGSISQYDVIKEKLNEKIHDNDIKNLLDVDNMDDCKNCKLKYLCGGICGASKFNNTVTEDDCLIRKFFIIYNIAILDESVPIEENILLFKDYLNKVFLDKFILNSL